MMGHVLRSLEETKDSIFKMMTLLNVQCIVTVFNYAFYCAMFEFYDCLVQCYVHTLKTCLIDEKAN